MHNSTHQKKFEKQMSCPFISNMLFGILTVLILSTTIGCQSVEKRDVQSRQDQVESKARAFFQTFAERNDWDKFCSFYREDLVFEDIILQLHLDSLWQLKRFYKWDEEGERFKKLSPEQEHLSISSLVVNDSIAVATGRVNPFYYDGHLIDTDWGMNFTIWLHFDQDMKITRQVDWFEYDSYSLESMITRCRKNGFAATPDWLDLTPE